MKKPLVAALATLALVGGCKTEQTTVYDKYEGPAPYPSPRTPVVWPAGEVALVTNSLSDSISVLDLAAGKVLLTEPIGRDPVDVDGPHHVTLDPARAFAYVALSYPAPSGALGPHASHGGSTRAGYVQKVALTDMRVVAEVRVDENPGDVVMSEDGSRVVVTHFDLKRAIEQKTPETQRATLAVIDPNTMGEPARFTVCAAPHGVTLSRPDGRFAYVACYGEDAIAVVDLTAPAASATTLIELGGGASIGRPLRGPYSAVLAPSGRRVAIGNLESRDVRFFDTAAKAMEPLIVPTQGAAYFPAFSADETQLFVPIQSPDQIAVFDTSTGQKLRGRALDAATCNRPHEAALSGDGTTLYVVCEGDHKVPSVVVALDATTLDAKGKFDVGIYPDKVLVFRRKP